MTIGFGHMEVTDDIDKGHFSRAVRKDTLIKWVKRDWKERMYKL